MLKDIKCPLCKNQKSCAIMGIGDYAVEKCGMFNPIENLIRNNADRIRAMTDEELAEWVAERSTAPNCTGRCHKDYEVYGELRTFCHDCWLDWLKKEAEK